MQKDTILYTLKKSTCLLFILAGLLLWIPTDTCRVEAASTCKSAISYPGTARAKVNMRKKAGLRYKSYGMVKKKQSVTILGYVSNGGVKWYKCRAQIGGKTRTGYISALYIRQQSKPKGIANERVNTYVKVRKKAKNSSKTVAKVTRGSEVTILRITKQSGKYWYKVRVTYNGNKKTGYIQAQYITVNGQQNVDAQNKEGYVNDNVTSTLNVRKEANTSSEILARIPRRTQVTILGETGSWYKIVVVYEGRTITGYVSKEYITIGSLPQDEVNNTPVSDADFATMLAAFPDSYKASIQALHNAYPNWRFVAVNTNLDWNAVIANESVVGRNVIQSNYPRGTNSLAPFSYLSTDSGAYNWAKDTYIVQDGTNWYTANSQVIAYYMDPRNFLNDTDIFQFEALSYDPSQSVAVVQGILNNTFMKGNYSVKDSATGKVVGGSYAQAFMDAGKAASANPYFLAARSKQEVGTNGSNSTSGTYKGYEGIYNYYNIGATDGGNAVAKGLAWAKSGTSYGRPWTNPYKSIVGGAQYIAMNYINKGQNTLYLQKFNVKPNDAAQLYKHQYMTNVQAPYSEGRSTRSAYKTMGVLSNTMIFNIPVFNNMPANVSALPAAAGNPNPYLSGITLLNSANTSDQFAVTSFAYNTFTYNVTVPARVATVRISASTVSSRATVEGPFEYMLGGSGSVTTVSVTGVAQNGTKQTYTINITRQ